MRPSRQGSAVLVGGLSCCGLVAVLAMILIIVVAQNFSNSDLVKGQSAVPVARRNLLAIRSALDAYTKDHDGYYPESLEPLVDPAFLSITSPTDNKPQKVRYRRPSKDAPPDISVASFYMGQMNVSIASRTTNQRIYVILLKDGSLVQEQVTRTPLSADGEPATESQ